MMSVNTSVPVLFCCDDLSVEGCGLLKPPVVWGLICDFTYLSICFIRLAAPVFSTYVFNVILLDCVLH